MWLLYLISIGAPQLSDATPEGAWKVHALQSAERLEGLERVLKQSPKDKQALCDKALQTAFVLHLTSESLVHKKNEGADFFHLVLQSGKDSVFDFAYVYSKKDGALVGARLTDLPKKWLVAFMEANKILVRTNDGCTYQLDVKNPFNAQVAEQ